MRLQRPAGRPSIKPLVGYKSFLYQAASWQKARPVAPKSGASPGRAVSASGLHRHEPEPAQPSSGAVLQQAWDDGQWIKEGKQAVKMTRLSCHRLRANEVRWRLSLIGLQLGKPVAAASAAEEIENWSGETLAKGKRRDGGVSENYAETDPSYRLAPTRRGTAQFSWVLLLFLRYAAKKLGGNRGGRCILAA
jgi:hypothetical protein